MRIVSINHEQVYSYCGQIISDNCIFETTWGSGLGYRSYPSQRRVPFRSGYRLYIIGGLGRPVGIAGLPALATDSRSASRYRAGGKTLRKVHLLFQAPLDSSSFRSSYVGIPIRSRRLDRAYMQGFHTFRVATSPHKLTAHNQNFKILITRNTLIT